MPLFCQIFYPLAPTIEIFLKYFLDKNSQDQPLCNLKAPNHCLYPALISSTTKGMTDVLCASVMLFPVAKAYTPPAMHIASYYVHNWYTFFAFQHDHEKCKKTFMSLIV